VARAGFFVPDGNNGRPRRTRALPDLHKAGAGEANVVLLADGHCETGGYHFRCTRRAK